MSAAQRIDAKEGKRLGAEIKSLTKGSQSYKTALAQQAAIKERTAERSVKIRELGERAQKTGGILSRFSGGLAAMGPAGAAGAAGIGLATAAGVGLVRMLNNQSAKTLALTRLATVSGLESTEIIERSGSALRTVTADADAAFAQVANVLSAAQRARQAATGALGPEAYRPIGLGASFSGVSVEAIQSGDIRRIVDDLKKSIDAGIGKDRLVLGLEMQGLDRETIASLGELATNADAATLAWENFNKKQLITPAQRRQALEWNDAVGDIKESVGEAQRDFTGQVAPGVTSIAGSVGDLSPATKELGKVTGGALNQVAMRVRVASLIADAVGDFFNSTGDISREERDAAFFGAAWTPEAQGIGSNARQSLGGEGRDPFFAEAIRTRPTNPPLDAGSQPQSAVQPEPARRSADAPAQAAVQPEPARRSADAPAQAAVQPEPARRSADAPAQAAVQPSPSTVQQYNTFYIEGATDTDSVLAGVELALTRTVLEIV